MIVHVSSLTTFWALDLVRQIARPGHLGKFYTDLPASMTPGLPEEKVCRQPLLLGPLYGARKLCSHRLQQALGCPAAELFDVWLVSQVASCDVFDSLLGIGLQVVATTNTRAEDLFTNGVEGFIAPIRHPEAIREKVSYLYENPDLGERMGHTALRGVQMLSGWNVYGQNVAREYAQALSKRQQSRVCGLLTD